MNSWAIGMQNGLKSAYFKLLSGLLFLVLLYFFLCIFHVIDSSSV